MTIDPRDLLVLLALARSQTHSAAARQLGVTHTTVSRHMRSLEKAAGGAVISVGPEGWELTALGRELAASAEMIEDALQYAEKRLRPAEQDQLRGHVRIRTAEAFGTAVVAPALGKLRLQHPGLSFELAWAVRALTSHGAGGDLGFSLQPPISNSRMQAKKIFDFHLGLYASKSYLAAYGEPTKLADLALHSPVYYAEPLRRAIGFDLFEHLFADARDLQTATTVAGHVELTAAGAGVGILPTYIASNRPELVRLFGDEVRLPLSVWMSSRTMSLRRPEVRLTAEAIELQAANTPHR